MIETIGHDLELFLTDYCSIRHVEAQIRLACLAQVSITTAWLLTGGGAAVVVVLVFNWDFDKMDRYQVILYKFYLILKKFIKERYPCIVLSTDTHNHHMTISFVQKSRDCVV